MENQVIEVTKYGDSSKSAPDLILTVLHDGDESLIHQRPDLRRAIKVSDQSLQHYLNLERDIGAGQFARQVGQTVAHLSKNRRRVDLVNVPKHHRGIIDLNRTTDYPQKAVRNIFDKSRYPALHRHLLQIHQRGIEEIINYLKISIRRTIILDCHTMWSYQPRTEIQENPYHIEDYLSAIMEPTQRGHRRHVNLLTSHANKQPISHPELTTKIINRLTALGIQICLDWPYDLVDYTTTTQIMDTYPYQGLSIDWPRSIFALHDPEDLSYNPFYPQLDDQKISQLAHIVALSILECLNTPARPCHLGQHSPQLDTPL